MFALKIPGLRDQRVAQASEGRSRMCVDRPLTPQADAALTVRDLSISIRDVEIVNDVSLDVQQGSYVAIVGESGAGKSMTALSLLRLHDEKVVTYGPQSSILVGDTDILECGKGRMRGLRGERISMVFQDPLSSLNPARRVGAQMHDVLRAHRKLDKRARRRQIASALEMVRLVPPEMVMRKYPHQLSGGMRQRILIAMASLCQPALLVADEPTSALDVSVQYEVLRTLDASRRKCRGALLLITHDMSLVANLCDYVYVMRAGRVVEHGAVRSVFETPREPYTKELLGSARQISVRSAPQNEMPLGAG